jgi:hypothetical protein
LAVKAADVDEGLDSTAVGGICFLRGRGGRHAMKRRSVVVGLLGAAALAGAGCYERTWFYPAPGQGQLVTNGERLGVAKRLSKDAPPDAQSFVVLSVKEAYTSSAGRGYERAVVQVTANVVNRAAAPARFESDSARLAAGGREFAPGWVYRSEPPPGAVAGRDEVAPGEHARFDLYFDLGPYSPGAAAMAATGAPPIEGGIPLSTLTDFSVSWKAKWAGREVSGSARFVRDYTGTVGGGWAAAPGPYWGWGWWTWPYAWPTGVVVVRAYFPWRVRLGPKLLKSPATRLKAPKLKLR